MSGIFVTATGTEIGKTFVACAIARSLSDQGVDVGVMKPVASGGARSEDAVLLKKAARSRDALTLINPICFKKPLAPYSAAQFENKKFSLKKVMGAFETIKKRHEFTVVEGVGGVRVPFTKNFEAADLMDAMKLPAVVVVSSKLGTLNHTLLTLDYLSRKKIEVLGIVLNFFDPKKIEDRTNLEFFKKKKISVLGVVPVSL